MTTCATTPEVGEDNKSISDGLVDNAIAIEEADQPVQRSIPVKRRPLSDFSVGDTVTAQVRTITSYGAFVDVGAESDALLHISQIVRGFVKDLNEVFNVGQTLENVRIVGIDKEKGQMKLSLLSDPESSDSSGQRQKQAGQLSYRRATDTTVVEQLAEQGWDTEDFVEGTVVSTADFGAFIEVDASTLNPECSGKFVGLAHISVLTPDRVATVAEVLNVEDKVQVRVKSIEEDLKVILSFLSDEDEVAKGDVLSGAEAVPMGNKNWKKDMDRILEGQAVFQNKPLIIKKTAV